MNCTQVRRSLFFYADNEMGEELVIEVREHLVLCPGCAREYDHTVKLLTVLRRRCARASAPERLRRRILTSFPHRQGQA